MNDYILKSVRASSIVGTTAMVAGTVLENSALEDEVIILADLTIGNLDEVSLMVEFSPDNSNWYQETNEAITAGATTAAVVAITHTFDATGKYRLTPIKIKDRYIKISVQGSGDNTSSLMKIDAIIGQDV